jgi:hypothetical protein
MHLQKRYVRNGARNLMISCGPALHITPCRGGEPISRYHQSKDECLTCNISHVACATMVTCWPDVHAWSTAHVYSGCPSFLALVRTALLPFGRRVCEVLHYEGSQHHKQGQKSLQNLDRQRLWCGSLSICCSCLGKIQWACIPPLHARLLGGRAC